MSIIDKIRDVFVWGDSLLKGITFSAAENKYSIYERNSARYISEKFHWNIINKSRFGCTAPKGKKLLDSQLQKGVRSDVALIEYGGNDCDFNWAEVSKRPEEKHIPKTPLDDFIRTVKAMIAKLKEKSILPVLMSIPPIDSNRYLDFISREGLSKQNILKWLGDVEHIYRWQEMYSHAISNIALEEGCFLIDVRSAFLREWSYKKYICDDGIHLNQQGHELMSKTFENFIQSRMALV